MLHLPRLLRQNPRRLLPLPIRLLRRRRLNRLRLLRLLLRNSFVSKYEIRRLGWAACPSGVLSVVPTANSFMRFLAVTRNR